MDKKEMKWLNYFCLSQVSTFKTQAGKKIFFKGEAQIRKKSTREDYLFWTGTILISLTSKGLLSNEHIRESTTVIIFGVFWWVFWGFVCLFVFKQK